MSASTPQAPRVCSRHSDREMLLTCRRCGRPYCAECLLQTHAGLHCHECAEVIRSSRPAVSKLTTWLAVLVGIVVVGVVVGAAVTGLIDLSVLDEWLPDRVQTLTGSSESTPADTPTPMPALTESQRVPTPMPAPTAPVESQESSARTESSPAEAAYNRGKDHLLAGNYDSAIQAFTEAIRLNPGFSAAYNGRGIAYVYYRSEENRAIRDYTEAIRLNPNDANAYHLRGGLYAVQGKYDRAVQDYTEAIRIDPGDAEAYYNRGLAYADQGQYDRAIQDYDQAIKLAPNDANAYYFRGTAYADQGEYDRAIQDFTEAIRLFPNEANAYRSQGTAIRRVIQGLPAVARFDLDFVYYFRGNAYGHQGEYDRAIQDFTEVIRLNPNDAAVYYLRGIAYMLKSEYDRARSDFNKALALGYDRAEVEAVLADLPESPSPRPGPGQTRVTAMMPTPITTGGLPTSTRVITIVPFKPSLKRSASIRTTPSPTTTGGLPTAAKASMTGPFKTTTRPSDSTRTLPLPTKTGDALTQTKASTIGPFKTMTRHSRSTPTMLTPTTAGELPTGAKASTTVPSKNSTRLSSSIRTLPPPTTTGALPTRPKVSTAAPRAISIWRWRSATTGPKSRRCFPACPTSPCHRTPRPTLRQPPTAFSPPARSSPSPDRRTCRVGRSAAHRTAPPRRPGGASGTMLASR